MNTPLIPYSRQEITENDIAAVIAVLRSDFLTQGTQVPAFERAMAERHEVAHAVAMGNATQGLHLACLALGVGPGSRVWTSPNSFVASANCALYCGASVDFVDIDPKTRNLSVAALRAKLVAARACATLPHLVIPVDFAGLPADLREMRELADEFDFKILEDASHATGSSYLGKPVGSRWADATVFSFHAVKVITTAEGGMVTTQDAALAERLRDLRSHGVTRDPYRLCQPSEGEWVYEQHSLGFNARMTELQAALGLSQLRRLESMHARRTALAARYKVLLAGLPLGLPEEFADRTSAWHLYPITLLEGTPKRTEVFSALRAAGIGVNVHYIPIHTQPFHRQKGFKLGDFPEAERYYANAISLPLHPTLTTDQQDQVVAAVRHALGRTNAAPQPRETPQSLYEPHTLGVTVGHDNEGEHRLREILAPTE
jgi:UDP-4-amino-4,6-dideoxy-N-acetyl-beta-L-altrosamine transaminase